jgi:hypothetical protein
MDHWQVTMSKILGERVSVFLPDQDIEFEGGVVITDHRGLHVLVQMFPLVWERVIVDEFTVISTEAFCIDMALLQSFHIWCLTGADLCSDYRSNWVRE